MADKLYDLEVHYLSYHGKISKVDPDRYNHVDLVDDIREVALSHVPSIHDLTFNLRCSIYGTNDFLDVASDNDVLTMFERNPNCDLIHLFLILGISNSANVEDEIWDADDEGETDGVNEERDPLGHVGDSTDEDIENGNNSGKKRRREKIVHIDDADISRNVPVDEHGNDSDFMAHVGGESETSNEQSSDSDSSDCWLSEYESDNHCEAENDSDDEFMNDPLHGCLDRDEVILLDESGKKFELENKMVFETIHAFRNALQDFVVQEGFNLVRDKNERTRVTAHCGGKGCKWRIHASLMPDKTSFQIKTYYGKHTCVREDTVKEATSTWMARKLVSVLRDDPDIKRKGLEAELRKYGLNPPYMTLYRARKRALDTIEGNHADSFTKLPKYVEMVKATNPGSLVGIQYHMEEELEDVVPRIPNVPSFKRFFLGLHALKKGFLSGCTSFLGFDGCHLKGSFGGVLLSAIGLDGNNGLYPLAFAVVEVESKESWCFFFENLANFLGGFNADRPWTFMTDRQKGLIEAIKELVPNAINRKCVRHIFANFRQQFAGIALKKYFWIAARAYNASTFNFAMYKIKELSPAGYKWLLEIPCELWSRHAYDLALKNEHVTNNLSESFNHWVSDLRPKPILSLLDGLRAKLMILLQRRHNNGRKWKNVLVPNVVKKLNEAREMSKYCTIIGAGENEFEILDQSVTYIVNLKDRSCNCRIWDITGIPCSHAAKAVGFRREKLESYTDLSFTTTNFMKAYDPEIRVVPDPMFWPEMKDLTPATILPPPNKRRPGRPKKNRKREPGELEAKKRSKIVRCKKCNAAGHNSRTCGKGPSQSKRRSKSKNRERDTTPHQLFEDGISHAASAQLEGSNDSQNKKARARTKADGKAAKKKKRTSASTSALHDSALVVASVSSDVAETRESKET